MINGKKLKEFFRDSKNPTELKELVKECIKLHLQEQDILLKSNQLLLLKSLDLLDGELQEDDNDNYNMKEEIASDMSNYLKEDIFKQTGEFYCVNSKVEFIENTMNKIVKYLDYLAAHVERLTARKDNHSTNNY